MGFLEDAFEKLIRPKLYQASLGICKLPGADPFGTFRGDDQVSTGLQDLHGPDHTLDCLVVGLVERVSGSAGDHRAKALVYGHLTVSSRIVDCCRVAREDLAEIDKREPTLFVDDGIQRERAAQHSDDLELFFVQRVVLENTVGSIRVSHEAGAVKGRDRFGVGKARRDHLAATRVAGHEVWLNESGGDLEVRLDDSSV